MLFDSTAAELAYSVYCNSHDPKLIAEIHQLSTGLIMVIAGSLNKSDYFDDLCQEGHLRLQRIIKNMSYRIGTKCSLYTFLSYCLRNAMIDYLRKVRIFDELDENIADTKFVDAVYDSSHFDLYYGSRFPSLGNNGSDLAVYIRDSIFEQAQRAKVMNTIVNVYGLQRCRANLLHNSVSLFLKLSMKTTLTELKLQNSLVYAMNGGEMTLKPESILANMTVSGYKQLLQAVSIL